MHIPDGFLSAPTCLSTGLVSAAGLALCLKKATGELKDRMVPLMGVMAAFIFAAQMVNFPVVSGTSGHLLGGVLASVLLGPYASAIVLCVVLTAQCFIFQDGGLTALGANILNMALLGPVSGYFIYAVLKRASGNIIFASAVAAWSSVVISAAAVSFELALSGVTPLKTILAAMVGIHVFVGLGEAVLTGLILSFVAKVRPDLIYE